MSLESARCTNCGHTQLIRLCGGYKVCDQCKTIAWGGPCQDVLVEAERNLPPLLPQVVDLLARLYAKTTYSVHADLTQLDFEVGADQTVTAHALTEHPKAIVRFTLSLPRSD